MAAAFAPNESIMSLTVDGLESNFARDLSSRRSCSLVSQDAQMPVLQLGITADPLALPLKHLVSLAFHCVSVLQASDKQIGRARHSATPLLAQYRPKRDAL